MSDAGSTTATSSLEDAASSGFYAEILLASFAALLIEINYTRVLSFKLYYYYTFLVVGLSLLGIGVGGVVVTISSRLRRASTESIVMWSLLVGAASVGAGYLVVALTTIDTLAIWDYGASRSFSNTARLVVICVGVFTSFIAIGVLIATLLGRRSEAIGRLYFADLLGAGLACAVVVALIGSIGPPATIMLAGLALAAAGMRLALRRRSRAIPAAAVLTLLLIVALVVPGVLPHQRLDATKVQIDDSTTLYSSWSPIFRVDAIQPSVDRRLLFHDGLPGSAIYRYNGQPSSLTRFDTDDRSLPFAVRKTPPERALIIGAAGGNEVLASLHFGAGHIDAIELNPVTYDLVTDTFADYDGHLAEDPTVNFVNGDGRSYLARSDKKYDLIWFPAPDSYAATNAATAGAFVLSESYLYTSQAIVDSLEHLAEGGVLAAQFGEFDYEARPNRTTRYVSTARKALAELGVDDPSRHIMVSTSHDPGAQVTGSTILIKRTPFTQGEIDRFMTGLEVVAQPKLRFAPGHPVQGSSVSELATISNDRLDDWYSSYPFNVRPISDDSPFFWHFATFSDVTSHITDRFNPNDFENGVGERVLLLLLLVAIVLAAIFLLLPFIMIRRVWSEFPRKLTSAVYFASIGFGFIFFEIALIQRLTLFLGYPTYSLTVTLMSILIFTGIGALLSTRLHDKVKHLVPALVVAITLLTAFYQFALDPATDALLHLPLAARVPIALIALAPLGLCLGMFMPLGLRAISDVTKYPSQYVAWGWAVNGFASVVGAVLSTILAMSLGFRTVMLIALITYFVALTALRVLLRASSSAPAAA